MDKIARIFTKVEEMIPENLDRAHEWLVYFRDEANRGFPWVDKLKGFVRGLWAAEVIEIEDLDDIDKLLLELGFIE